MATRCTVPGCTAPAMARVGRCAGHLSADTAAHLVDQLDPESPWTPLAHTALGQFGELLVGSVNHLVDRAAGQARADTPRPEPEHEPVLEHPTTPEADHRWLRSIGFRAAGDAPTRAEVESFRRTMAKVYHPDKGAPVDPDFMVQLNKACDALLAQLEE